ncbi:MAG TPA: hypothetical protein VM238_09190 [Phycisphaerae bacterium]|nr:hypothetical protein [Phycisphaerae bacterium]
MDWTSNQAIAIYIALGLVAAGVIVWLVMRKTVRTRVRTEREVRQDPDIHDWLVIFNWSRKALYVPTIAVSLAASTIMFLREMGLFFDAVTPEIIGGVWFTVFFLNFMVEEFEINVKVVLIGTLCLLALLLWLHLLGWVRPFVRMFGHVTIQMSWMGYLALAIIGMLTIGISWVRGLFYYVVFTPNYMNIQWGLTESGDHVGREDYNTHVDTTDLLERLMGFGKIVIVFKDQKRPPLTLLVWRIGRRAELLERVRGKFAIDMNAAEPRQEYQAPQEPADPVEPGQ